MRPQQEYWQECHAIQSMCFQQRSLTQQAEGADEQESLHLSDWKRCRDQSVHNIIHKSTLSKTNKLFLVLYFFCIMQSVKYSLQKTYSHVNIPPIGDSVEVTPAGSILCWYWAPLGCTQHRHHIVMDGSSHIKFLEKFWSADENAINLRCNTALLPHN